MKMKKILAFALVLVMLLTISACRPSATATPSPATPATATEPAAAAETAEPPSIATTEPDPGTGESALTVSIATSPETIDPTLNSSVDGATYVIHYFEGLMRYKWDGTGVEYGMAESYTVSDDGLVWTFKLRDSNWSDGQPVRAQDFEYAWKRLVDPDVAAPYAEDMGVFIKNGLAISEGHEPVDSLGVKVLDDKTFEVTLQDPTPYFTEIAAFPVFVPIREDIISQYGDAWTRTGDTYVCNGAFKMQSFNLDEKMVSVPNPQYWDVQSIVPTQITWLFLDDVASLAAFKSRELCYVRSFPQEETKALQQDGVWIGSPYLGTYYVSFNHQKAPIDQLLVRKALTLAVDTNYIAETIREGLVDPAGAMVGPGFTTAGYNREFRAEGKQYINSNNYEANKEEARQALAEAGYPNGEGFPRLEYSTNDTTGHRLIAEALQQMWKEVLNIDIEIRVGEWGVFLADRRAGSFELARNGWIGDYNDPLTMLNLFLSNSGNNDGKYNSAAFDTFIATSSAEADPNRRNELLHLAEDVLMSDYAFIPIYYYLNEGVVAKNLKDFYRTPLGYDFLHRAYLD